MDTERFSATSDTYNFTLSGDGIDVKRTIDLDTARNIVGFLMGGSTPKPSDSGKPGEEDSSDESKKKSKVSVREYFQQAQDNRKIDQITAIGGYLNTQNNQQLFSQADVRTNLQAAGEATSSKLVRDLGFAVSAGLMAKDSDDPELFYVTNTGYEGINAQFSLEFRTRMHPAVKRPRKSSNDKTSKAKTAK